MPEVHPEEKCVRVDIIPANNKDILDCRQDKVIMYFPTQPPYEFGYWGDEINFTESELIGLTKSEAGELYTKKDIAYIQS